MHYVLITLYVGCISYAMWTDATRMIIPNEISIILALSFFLFAFLNLELIPTTFHIGVASVVFAITFSCYLMHWMGGGDVKLLSASSIWMGPDHILTFITHVALLGGLLALGAIVLRHAATSSIVGRYPSLSHRLQQSVSRHIPYAVPIGCAALISGGALY